MNFEEAITRAAELAEAILDEVASAHQDWARVAEWARELAELASGLASAPPAAPG
jgi:hypothetical protein